MTYKKRKELEQLSTQAFGSKYTYQKRMKQPSHYTTDTFGSVTGKRAAGYATLDQIHEAMLKIISERNKDLLEEI
jgi:hypothetical protein